MYGILVVVVFQKFVMKTNVRGEDVTRITVVVDLINKALNE